MGGQGYRAGGLCERPASGCFRLHRLEGLGPNHQLCHWSMKAATDHRSVMGWLLTITNSVLGLALSCLFLV